MSAAALIILAVKDKMTICELSPTRAVPIGTILYFRAAPSSFKEVLQEVILPSVTPRSRATLPTL